MGFRNAEYLGRSAFFERDLLYDIRAFGNLFPKLETGGIGFSVGYEHRAVSASSVPDPVLTMGDPLGFAQSPAAKTRQKVDSLFGELQVPVVTAPMNVPMFNSLELSFAYRYERFKAKDQFTHRVASFTNANPEEDFGGTPRIAIRYQPIRDLVLRASWSQSVRGPTPSDLFHPVAQEFPVVFDPINRIALALPEGVWRGGKQTLIPERTDSYTAGVVYGPSFLPSFTVTADYYQLFTRNVILNCPDFAQLLLAQNVIDPDGFGQGSGAIGATGGPALGVTRDANGNLLGIDSTLANGGKRLVTGLDVTAAYELYTDNWGTFNLSVGYNHFFTWKAEAVDGMGTHNFLGDFNASVPLTPGGIPVNKGYLRGAGSWKSVDFVATGNYLGEMEDDPAFIAGNIQIGGTPQETNWRLHRRITSYITLDLQLSYEFRKPEPNLQSEDDQNLGPRAGHRTIWQRLLWGTKIALGVNNAFDRQPLTVLAASNDNYDTSNYSIRNRY